MILLLVLVASRCIYASHPRTFMNKMYRNAFAEQWPIRLTKGISYLTSFTLTMFMQHVHTKYNRQIHIKGWSRFIGMVLLTPRSRMSNGSALKYRTNSVSTGNIAVMPKMNRTVRTLML
jgi:hypothetical protein